MKGITPYFQYIIKCLVKQDKLMIEVCKIFGKKPKQICDYLKDKKCSIKDLRDQLISGIKIKW